MIIPQSNVLLVSNPSCKLVAPVLRKINLFENQKDTLKG